MSREEKAAENRRLFPTAAEAMDKLACFSPRVLYASQPPRPEGRSLSLY